ncbi:DUF3000 domain-containing protein [Nocardioides acrostichi]|uniref:DUF3000 domain-containing protein n=1 Tax=Nocardioides acrostichi TaxID=2784339 RepID=A0A930Y4I5_9ACTN|nr:DUF3000 domain-containing protein [Nocardioides acrostichi]MBF4160220.1 DUF3000 domain-containing protein [Nocardioides acrostichi]
MVARQEMRPSAGAPTPPAEFREAVTAMQRARLRPEIVCEQMPAPQRIAPWSYAVSADVVVEHDELATGRLILLHDPAGNDTWEGTFRCVAYARAEVESELAGDDMVGSATWSILTEHLESHGAAWTAESGTVTRITTESFGGMDDEPLTVQVEIRASWTPLAADGLGTPDLEPHVGAWADLLCMTGGLSPVPDGVAMMPSRRGQRGH